MYASAEGGAVDGGCSGSGYYCLVNWHITVIYITTPCFHCTPLCGTWHLSYLSEPRRRNMFPLYVTRAVDPPLRSSE